ncbi:MAG: acetate kinase [Bacteroidales bacterium]|nr:acetate kinase [Bacteroidales bacterium]MCQ2279609.1 acetate kinase [Bacteroidales bacterium]
MMKVLVINCGSSSLKYQLIDMANNAELKAKGLVERIGLEMGEFTHKPVGKDKYYTQTPIPDHAAGIKLVLDALTDPKMGVISSLDEIGAVGHRVAHGGEYFKASCRIDAKAIEEIEKLCKIAPLHNPASLVGINSMMKLLPNVTHVAVFDTSFHQTMPPQAYLYAIPYKYYEEDRIRRYGFHGTSHKFVGPRAAELAGVDYNHSKIISCHLGSGASICAIKDGKSVDTSMGFTPVEGLVMGTRCGDLDLGALIHIAEKEGMDFKRMTTFINKECGLKGVSGKGVDMRDIRAGKDAGDERSTYAFDMFSYRVKKYIGAYAAAMGGVDVILFTGGIGENAFFQREPICEGLEFLGAKLDKEKNKTVIGDDAVISTPDSKVKIVVVATNEELVIATDTYNIAMGK